MDSKNFIRIVVNIFTCDDYNHTWYFSIFFTSHTLISHSLQVDDVDIGPYAYKNNQWVGYDTVNYAKKKANYIIEKDLGGAMFWETSTDDFNVKKYNTYISTYIYSTF